MTYPAMIYPDVANPALLERIPLAARSLLDVGCGSGALGAAYRRLNPAARLLGIEPNAAAAAIAATRMDAVAVVDVEQSPMPFDLPPGGLDCIVYGDVLEHLRDPWAVLARHAKCLAPEGVMLISVPNVEHWSLAARLLLGGWDYEDQGLFDRTHLRWFSGATMRRDLEALGLHPCDVTPLIYDQDRAAGFTAAIGPALAALEIDPAAYLGRAAPLQYLWRVRRAPRAMLTVAASMMEHVGGVSHVRVLEPARALSTDPTLVVHVAGTAGLPSPGADGPKVFILHRPVLVGSDGLDMLAHLLEEGWVVVSEFDDHPDFFPALQRPDSFGFRGVHAVQTSTGPLAAVLRARNPEVAVFPNAIRSLPAPRNFTDWHRLTLFFGGLNREQDWQPLLPVLNAVAAQLGPRLGFCIVHDQALFDALDTPHKRFTPTCDYATYFDLLGGCEISLMPLGDTWFNRCKSDLKFIEACACRVAALASPVVYADSVQDGRTGVLFATPEELRGRLLRLVANPETARTLADAGRDWVATHRMLAYQTGRRAGWYRGLWAQRAALTAALLARTPELAGRPIGAALR